MVVSGVPKSIPPAKGDAHVVRVMAQFNPESSLWVPIREGKPVSLVERQVHIRQRLAGLGIRLAKRRRPSPESGHDDPIRALVSLPSELTSSG